MVVRGAGRVPEAVVGGEAGLTALHARVAGRFARPEARARARRYLAGLLGRVERKNGWQLAEALGEAGPQGVQRLLNAATWDAEGVRDDLRAYVVEHLGDAASGVLIVDETGFVKKGTQSCGVGTQYSGAVGGTANTQVGVFLAYASARGTAFVDRALYLPRAWAHDRARRAEAGVPDGLRFATKLTLAKRLLARAFAAGVPARWVVGDAAYGRSHAFRRWLEDGGRPTPCRCRDPRRLVEGEGRRQRRPSGPRASRRRLGPRSAGTGVQGERVDDWVCLPLAEAAAPGWRRWLLVRRGRSTPTTWPSTSPSGRRTPRRRSWCGSAAGAGRWRRHSPRPRARWARPVRGAQLDRLAPLRDPGPARARLPGRDAPRRQPGRGGRQRGGPDPGLIPLTVPEVRRLLLALAERGERRAHRLRWSRWRRAHQAGANRCHASRRARERAQRPAGPAAAGPPRARGADRRRVGPAPAVAAPAAAPRRPAPARPPPRPRRDPLGGAQRRLLARPAPRFGKWERAYRRYRLWSDTGLWERILSVLGSATDRMRSMCRCRDRPAC